MMTELDPTLRPLLEAVVRGEYTDIDFRYDGSSFMPDLRELAALRLVTLHEAGPGNSPYLASCHATELGRSVARGDA
mgnify:CR=1 FL=1